MPCVARGSFVIEGLICTDTRSSAMGGQPGKPKPIGNPPIRREPQRPQPIEEPPRPLPVPPVERPPLPMQASNYVREKATIDHLVKECYEAKAPERRVHSSTTESGLSQRGPSEHAAGRLFAVASVEINPGGSRLIAFADHCDTPDYYVEER